MNTYYFSHEINHRHKRNIKRMRFKYKLEGYGLYWMIREALAEEYTFTLELNDEIYKLLADDFKCDVGLLQSFVKDCIDTFKLFSSDGVVIWCEELLENMSLRDKTIQSRIAAGRLGGIKSGESRRKLKLETTKQDEFEPIVKLKPKNVFNIKKSIS